MLFNTLAYAKFFALVFAVAWVLVSRRWAPLLPWFGVAGYALFRPPALHGIGVGAIALVLTVALCRRESNDTLPRSRIAAASVVINFAALAWLTFRDFGRDPLTLGLASIGLPVPQTAPLSTLGVVLAGLALYALVRAKKVRLLFILGASYVFYAHWDWRFLPTHRRSARTCPRTSTTTRSPTSRAKART